MITSSGKREEDLLFLIRHRERNALIGNVQINVMSETGLGVLTRQMGAPWLRESEVSDAATWKDLWGNMKYLYTI